MKIQALESAHKKPSVADVRPGEIVRVHYKIRESGKERIQVFEGLVIGETGGQTLQGSFTVRKVVDGIGVERTFPLHSPWIVKIERVKTGKVRRAKLNFVRRYALSRRFKLKDKGIEGSVWEEVAKEKAEVAKEEERTQEGLEEPEEKTEAVDETPEVQDNGSDDVSEQDSGNESGESGSEPAKSEEAPDSEDKPSN